MDDEKLNLEIRKFLKHFGITSQLEIEKSVREAVANNTIQSNENLDIIAEIRIKKVKLEHKIEGTIKLN